MTPADLSKLPGRSVAIFLNAIGLLGHIPAPLKVCRTTLIPKGDADLDDVSSWRPITVANILLRVLRRIIAGQMSAQPLHPSQRGFVSLDGTMANSIILQAAIKDSRSSASPYSITALDFRKASTLCPTHPFKGPFRGSTSTPGSRTSSWRA